MQLPQLRALIAGDYTIEAIGMKMKVFEQDGRPMVQGAGQIAVPILWQGEGEFRASFDPSVKLIWKLDGKSFELHQGGGVFVATKNE